MQIQYKQVVGWDSSLIDVGFLGSEQSVPTALRGLAISAVKVTTGAPSQVAGQWAPGAQVANAIDGTVYIMNGTTAAPTWEVIEAGTIALANGKILVGNASGVAVGVTPSGDVTVSNAGVIKIALTDQAAGDIMYYNGTGWVRLAKGTAGQVLTMNAGATAPEWQTPA